ncbi:MAG TPA: hypothetical protein VFB06_19895 [Streptosporangiaceae bacterium]|nr:hypothetical protein [Streptosporangiaceae bacterium]
MPGHENIHVDTAQRPPHLLVGGCQGPAVRYKPGNTGIRRGLQVRAVREYARGLLQRHDSARGVRHRSAGPAAQDLTPGTGRVLAASRASRPSQSPSQIRKQRGCGRRVGERGDDRRHTGGAVHPDRVLRTRESFQHLHEFDARALVEADPAGGAEHQRGHFRPADAALRTRRPSAARTLQFEQRSDQPPVIDG